MRTALWIATTLETLVRGPLLDSQQDKNIYLKNVLLMRKLRFKLFPMPLLK